MPSKVAKEGVVEGWPLSKELLRFAEKAGEWQKEECFQWHAEQEGAVVRGPQKVTAIWGLSCHR